MTGCTSHLRGRRSQHHRESEEKDQLRREVQAAFGRSRVGFLTALLKDGSAEPQALSSSPGAMANHGKPSSTSITDSIILKNLERRVDEQMPICSSSSLQYLSPRLQLARAYLAVSARSILPCETLSESVLMEDTPSDSGSDGGEEYGNDADLIDADNCALGNSISKRGVGQCDMQRISIQLCLQWVVARELSALAKMC